MKQGQLEFDELHVLIMSGMSKRYTVDEKTECFYLGLVKAYLLGNKHASQMMEESITPNENQMNEIIYQLIDGKTYEDRLLDHIANGDSGKLEILVESEL